MAGGSSGLSPLQYSGAVSVVAATSAANAKTEYFLHHKRNEELSTQAIGTAQATTVGRSSIIIIITHVVRMRVVSIFLEETGCGHVTLLSLRSRGVQLAVPCAFLTTTTTTLCDGHLGSTSLGGLNKRSKTKETTPSVRVMGIWDILPVFVGWAGGLPSKQLKNFIFKNVLLNFLSNENYGLLRFLIKNRIQTPLL